MGFSRGVVDFLRSTSCDRSHGFCHGATSIARLAQPTLLIEVQAGIGRLELRARPAQRPGDGKALRMFRRCQRCWPRLESRAGACAGGALPAEMESAGAASRSSVTPASSLSVLTWSALHSLRPVPAKLFPALSTKMTLCFREILSMPLESSDGHDGLAPAGSYG